jgi:hypothetical protein
VFDEHALPPYLRATQDAEAELRSCATTEPLR